MHNKFRVNINQQEFLHSLGKSQYNVRHVALLNTYLIGVKMKQHRILLLDGISRWPMGIEFYQALKGVFSETYYLSQKNFDRKYLYNIRRMFSKMRGDKPKEYVHPKLIFSQLKEKITKIQPTIVVVLGYSHNLVHSEDLKALKKKLGFQLVLWETDSANYAHTMRGFREYIQHEFMRYDKIFSFSSTMARYMQRLNFMPIEYLHYGAVAYDHGRAIVPEKNIDVCFVGNPCLRRLLLLSGIENEKLCIIAEKWKRLEKFVPDKIKNACIYKDLLNEELYEILFRSKVVVNITKADFYGIDSGVNLRVFEALALKCFLLTDDYPEVRHLFEPGKEIETYSSHEEFIDKASFYSKNDDARNKIAAAGYEKFINNYTWGHQAKKMLDLLGVAY
ncbi:MAG: glycosyltransferase [Gammaproteobacteria bacterium]|nr:glycosyltransferase [Gammaproteobacteria bacterium]